MRLRVAMLIGMLFKNIYCVNAMTFDTGLTRSIRIGLACVFLTGLWSKAIVD